MMTYTEIGLALITDAIASGKQVRFSKIELIADPERSARELIHNADIASVEKYNNTTIDIKAVTDNYNFKNDYFFNRVNVYATGSGGQEVLFCFQHTATCPVYIPAYDGRTIQNEIKIRLTVTSADVVDIVNDGVYVLRTDFEKELAKKINTADIIQDADSDAVDKVVSAAVAKYLKEQIEDKIDKSAIIQNATTAALDKVVSAAVAKNLQDQITAQNTNIVNIGNQVNTGIYMSNDNIDNLLPGNYWVNGYSSSISGDIPFTNMHYMLVASGTAERSYAQVAIPMDNTAGKKGRIYSGGKWSKWI